MQKTRFGETVETATEARAGERGPTMLIVLTASLVGAAVVLFGMWFFAVL